MPTSVKESWRDVCDITSAPTHQNAIIAPKADPTNSAIVYNIAENIQRIQLNCYCKFCLLWSHVSLRLSVSFNLTIARRCPISMKCLLVLWSRCAVCKNSPFSMTLNDPAPVSRSCHSLTLTISLTGRHTDIHVVSMKY